MGYRYGTVSPLGVTCSCLCVSSSACGAASSMPCLSCSAHPSGPHAIKSHSSMLRHHHLPLLGLTERQMQLSSPDVMYTLLCCGPFVQEFAPFIRVLGSYSMDTGNVVS